jgi:HSP20 family protein
MAITRWDPFRDVLTFQNRLQSLLTDYSRESGGRDADTLTAGAFVPPVDIYEDADRIVLTLEVPGIPQDAFDISVENQTLSVRGERQWKSEQKEENYHRVERRYGSFHRAFTLPQTVDTEHVEASYDAGVLRIELKKRPESKSRQIKVQLGSAAPADKAGQPAQMNAPATAEAARAN